ncbi:MAG: hypothetical protein KBH71_10885 [Anaerolineae bacterium]|nr:hypothetical protein [Anaerolineae bacterium]HQE98708.1 hypothetical protein [Anaerolineae bacterium]HRT31906.1 hypothetical protein [Anaerolineae bacterium]HXK44050.1 hypothetical protein [Anaerolineae bacterium]
MNRMPAPKHSETPVSYADRVGRWAAETAPDLHKQKLGQYMIPAPVAQFMAQMLTPTPAAVQMLDPGAGAGILSCAILEAVTAAVASVEITAKEQARRLTAAPYMQAMLEGAALGLENHLNYIYRSDNTMSIAEAYGLAALLNSRLLDTHFRTFN